MQTAQASAEAATIPASVRQLLEERRPEEWGIVGHISAAKQREGQKNGHKTQSDNANTNRLRWWNEAVRVFIEGYDSHTYIKRDQIIDKLRAFNLAYRIKGKGGKQIKRSTISRWLTSSVESSIVLEAISRLISRSR